MLPDTELVLALQSSLGVELHPKTATEYAGPCPKCGGEDRFVVFMDGKPRFWCRVCKWRGFVDGVLQVTPEQRAEFVREAQEQQRQQHEQTELAIRTMANSTDHTGYYAELLQRPEKLAWWLHEGITMESIHQHTLGWCARCPTDKLHRASFTIPVFRGGKLIDIQHRLEDAPSGDKYRPHMKHLPGKLLFNADAAKRSNTGIIVEGAKKAIVLQQLGYHTVAILGKARWDASTFAAVQHWDPCHIALDPDAIGEAVSIAQVLGSRAIIVKPTLKIDDMITIHGCGKADIDRLLRYGRRARRDNRHAQ